MRCSDSILSRFLLTVLLSDDFNRFVNERVKGDRPRTSFATIATYRIDLPSLEEQAEVARGDERLQSAVSHLADARTEFERNGKRLLDATRSRLIWDHAESKTLVLFRDLVDSIDYGTSQRSVEDGVGTAILRIPNIGADGRVDPTSLKFAPLGPKETEQFSLRTDDLLMIRSNGSLQLVGRAARVGETDAKYAFAGYLLRLRPKPNVLAGYLLELVHSKPFRQMVEATARSTNGINNLSASRLAQFSVPLPSVGHQRRIESTLGKLQLEISSSFERIEQMWLAALTLQKTARQIWLAQRPNPAVSGLASEPTGEDVAAEHINVAEPEMSGDIENVLLERIDSEKLGQATFEKLAEGVGADYETLRDTVFKMLSASPQRLEQIFDKKSRAIMLRRPR